MEGGVTVTRSGALSCHSCRVSHPDALSLPPLHQTMHDGRIYTLNITCGAEYPDKASEGEEERENEERGELGAAGARLSFPSLLSPSRTHSLPPLSLSPPPLHSLPRSPSCPR